MQGDPSECWECEHLFDLEKQIHSKGMVCEAFPTGDNMIPDEIISAGKPHHEVIAGQVGDFVYKPDTEAYDPEGGKE